MPLGIDHALDVEVFDVIAGAVDVIDVGGEIEEGAVVFAWEEEDISKQAVLERIAGGDEFAHDGCGAMGLGSVGAGGGALEFGSFERHTRVRPLGLSTGSIADGSAGEWRFRGSNRLFAAIYGS